MKSHHQSCWFMRARAGRTPTTQLSKNSGEDRQRKENRLLPDQEANFITMMGTASGGSARQQGRARLLLPSAGERLHPASQDAAALLHPLEMKQKVLAWLKRRALPVLMCAPGRAFEKAPDWDSRANVRRPPACAASSEVQLVNLNSGASSCRWAMNRAQQHGLGTNERQGR